MIEIPLGTKIWGSGYEYRIGLAASTVAALRACFILRHRLLQ